MSGGLIGGEFLPHLTTGERFPSLQALAGAERMREEIILKLCEMEANEKGVTAATIRDIRHMVENLEV